MDMNAMMDAIVLDLRIQQQQLIENVLGEGIRKGIITVRQTEPVLVMLPDSDKPKMMASAVIEYSGAEKIEELEKKVQALEHALEFMKKTNSELHQALSDFYERTKENTWLKSY